MNIFDDFAMIKKNVTRRIIMGRFPIGVIIDSFRTDTVSAVKKAASVGADGIQAVRTDDEVWVISVDPFFGIRVLLGLPQVQILVNIDIRHLEPATGDKGRYIRRRGHLLHDFPAGIAVRVAEDKKGIGSLDAK